MEEHKLTESTTLEASYDREASQYDAKRYTSTEGEYFNEFEAQMILGMLEPKLGMRILDVPAGTGRLTVQLAKTGASIAAVDISNGMLAQAQRKTADLNLHNVSFHKADARKLPFEDASFDAVTSLKFFHLVSHEDKQASIAEMHRVLKPGGTLIAEFNSPFYGVGLAFFRYHFRKRQPGHMSTKCLFPNQVHSLFSQFSKTTVVGVKLPFSGLVSHITGRRLVNSVNRGISRVPVFRQLCYVLIVAATKKS